MAANNSGGGMSTLDIVLAGANAATSTANSLQQAGNSKRNMQIAREQLAEQRRTRQQATAVDESDKDPFRQQLAQSRAIGLLDMQERGTYAPVKVAPAGPYASYMPQISGGFNYTKSPEAMASAGMLKRNVMAGNTAPTMTDPKNYGKTAALDILALQRDGVDPAQVNGARSAPQNPDAYLEDYQRRMAGKAFSAETRGTDLSVVQAREILANVIQTELGRPPNQGEIDQMLIGQGLQMGGQWVGEAGLRSIINAIRSQASPRPSYSGRG